MNAATTEKTSFTRSFLVKKVRVVMISMVLFGKTEAELINQVFMPLVHPGDRAETEKAMEPQFFFI